MYISITDACITTTPEEKKRKATRFYLLFSLKTNPFSERRASDKPVYVWLWRLWARWHGGLVCRSAGLTGFVFCSSLCVCFVFFFLGGGGIFDVYPRRKPNCSHVELLGFWLFAVSNIQVETVPGYDQHFFPTPVGFPGTNDLPSLLMGYLWKNVQW